MAIIKKESKEVAVRIFLFLFILGILAWLIPSTIGFVNLDSAYSRAGELPQWLQSLPAFQRALIIILFVQLPYIIIAIALFAELLKPNIKWRYNKDKFLTFIAAILIFAGLFSLFKYRLFSGFAGLPLLYDTIIYGVGFGILFLLSIEHYSAWMKILLWARLIEVWGPLIGYDMVPAALGRYTGGAFGHFGYGFRTMITSQFFITDFAVQIFSVIGVMYLLKKAGFKLFWIISFSAGAIGVGIALTYILPAIF